MYSQVLICNTIRLSTMVTWIIMIHLFDISVFINLFSYFLNFNLRAAPWNIFGLVPFLINSMLILQNSLTTEKIQTCKRWWKDNFFLSQPKLFPRTSCIVVYHTSTLTTKLLKPKVYLQWGHLDLPTFTYRAKMRECKDAKAKVRSCKDKGTKWIHVCEGKSAKGKGLHEINFALSPLQLHTFAFTFFYCIQQVSVNCIQFDAGNVQPKVW